MFADHPLLGVGLGCSVIAWPLYAPKDLYSRGALVTHNTVIQPLGETGVFGFVAFVSFVGFGIYYARKLALDASRRSLANLGAGLEIAVWGFVVCGLSGGYVLTWFPYILVGMVSSAARIRERTDGRRTHDRCMLRLGHRVGLQAGLTVDVRAHRGIRCDILYSRWFWRACSPRLSSARTSSFF